MGLIQLVVERGRIYRARFQKKKQRTEKKEREGIMADKQQQTKPQQPQAQRPKQDGKPRPQQQQQQQGGQAKKPQQQNKGSAKSTGAQQQARKPAQQANGQPKPQVPALSPEQQAAVDTVLSQTQAAGVRVSKDDALNACKGANWNVDVATQKLKGTCINHSDTFPSKKFPATVSRSEQREQPFFAQHTQQSRLCFFPLRFWMPPSYRLFSPKILLRTTFFVLLLL